MRFGSRDEYINWVRELRKRKELHPEVEKRLAGLLSGIVPDYHPVAEPLGLAGGRNDLMLFEFSGRKALFEIFGTASQVSRDLRILDKTKADRKVAVIIDKDVDGAVFDRFLKENPEDNYPFLFVGELYEDPPIDVSLKLRQLVLGDEEAKFQRMLRAKIPRESFYEGLRKEGIDVLLPKDVKTQNVTFKQVFVTLILGKCRELGVREEKLKRLGHWLSQDNVLKYTLARVNMGLNMILYTDFGGNMAVYADIELVDWIRITHQLPELYVILSMNSIIHEIEDDFLKLNDAEKLGRDLKMTVGFSQIHDTNKGRVVVFQIPRDTKSIRMVTPVNKPGDETEGLGEEDYIKMMKFNRPGDVIHIP
jgi:hypothetical protein